MHLRLRSLFSFTCQVTFYCQMNHFGFRFQMTHIYPGQERNTALPSAYSSVFLHPTHLSCLQTGSFPHLRLFFTNKVTRTTYKSDYTISLFKTFQLSPSVCRAGYGLHSPFLQSQGPGLWSLAVLRVSGQLVVLLTHQALVTCCLSNLQ